MSELKGKQRSYIITGLVFLGSYAALLFLLELAGVIVFVNRFSLFREYITELGSSIFLFSGLLVLTFILALQLKSSLDTRDGKHWKWNSRLDQTITLFFGVGVIYTAAGMYSAFKVAIGNMDQAAAQEMGPWGILENLVDGGLLTALLTTIVGGVLGYFFRFVKSWVFDDPLARA